MNTASADVQVIRVGIAEGAVVRTPERIRTTGLGSCVGVVLYDTAAGIAGLVHIMLPVCAEADQGTVTKFANTGVPWMMEQILRAGAEERRVRAKLAGGAQMFAFAGKSDIMRVGPRNVEAVKDSLQKLGIPITAEDIGGNSGRTIEFDGATETLWIRTAMTGSYSI